jgi:dipeptidyl aminopeptidase/acylaminoacyl peptidase
MLRILCLFLLPSLATSAEKRPMQIEDLFKFKRVAEPQISPDGKLVVYQVTSVDLDANKSSTNLWLAATDGKTPSKQLTTTPKSDRHPRWSPDGKKILFESNRSGSSQLWVIALDGGEAKQLTNISTGASGGMWSPDAKKIAFVSSVYPEFSDKPFKESDAANKKKLEETEASPIKAKVFSKLFYRHWDEYVEDKRQHLFVITAEGGEPQDITPGDRDANPTSSTFSVGDDFTFSPSGKYIVYTAPPERDEAWSTDYNLYRVPVSGGKSEVLTKENLAADNSPRFSDVGGKLAYRSQKKAGYEADKWDILVVDVDADGAFKGKPKNLTSEKDVSVNEFLWNPHGGLVFTCDEKGSNSIYSVTLNGEISSGVSYDRTRGKVTAMPGGNAGMVSSFSTDKSGHTWICSQAHMSHPARIFGAKFENNPDTGVTVGVVEEANSELLKNLDLGSPESVSIEVEGAKMQMWILKPPGFDPAKKWPVAYLIHGGPQGAWEDGWSFRWNPQAWAAQGYVVVMPNPRGSTGFGQKFVDQISGDWGGKCYDDLMKGLDYVEKLPYVDKDRIGSAGASFGGYMMNWFAVSTNKFKCLITHCSVWNFESMWGTTDELWFDEYEHGGLPWDKPESYAKFSPHKKAQNLGKFKTPMLIIHNDNDFRCPIGQGHELFSALQRQKVPSRFVNFPDEGHWVLKPKNSQYWHQEVFSWLKKYVPPGGK